MEILTKSTYPQNCTRVSHILSKKKLKLKLGFFFRNKNGFKRPVPAMFFCFSMVTFCTWMHQHSVYICTPLLIIVHCTQRLTGPLWPLRGFPHWYCFIYKNVLGLLPSHLCVYMQRKDQNKYALLSWSLFLLTEFEQNLVKTIKSFHIFVCSSLNEPKLQPLKPDLKPCCRISVHYCL